MFLSQKHIDRYTVYIFKKILFLISDLISRKLCMKRPTKIRLTPNVLLVAKIYTIRAGPCMSCPQNCIKYYVHL